MADRRTAWLAALALASVGVSLIGRVVVRGVYYPGFDVHAAANGLFLLSTRTPWDALTFVWDRSRTYAFPFPYYSALYALLAGALTALHPWEWWAPLLTFVSVGVALAMLRRALGLARTDAWIILLAVGASPAVLSFAVAGMPWASAFLPHALALWIVLDPRLRRRWLTTAVLCVATIELTWHVYELGKTVGAVFVLGAVLLRGVPAGMRLVWLGAATLQISEVFLYPSQHVSAYSGIVGLHVGTVLARIGGIAAMLFVSPWLDLPVLAVAAILACLRMTRTRALLLALCVAQLGLVVLVGLRESGLAEVRPRRFLTVDFYLLALVVSLWGEANAARLKRVIVVVLLAGNLWALADLVRFARTPWEPANAGAVFTLPFVSSQLDYMLWPTHVDWVLEMERRIDAGQTMLLVYGLDAYDENYSNPDGILERLYVRLGHRRFVESVVVFSSVPCHHDCVPVRPLSELEPYLDQLRAAGPERWARVVGYQVQPHQWDTDAYKADREKTIIALDARFTLVLDSPATDRVVRFHLAPLS